MVDSPNGKLKNIPFTSQIVPEKLLGKSTFKFNCHKGVSCFNACCKAIDIALAPYDIIQLKQHLKIDSRQFLATYTVPYEMDGHAMPGVKLKTVGDTTQCPFVTPEGCGVYEARPTACRYYALGLMSMRETDKFTDDDYYFTVSEDHCKGHEEDKEQTVDEYRESQGIPEMDDLNREWRQLILKKRSSGPTIGKPSTRSNQLFFMSMYNVDALRNFVTSEGFTSVYDLDDEFYESIKEDDVAMLKFGYKLMKQVLFGEMTIPVVDGALEKRVEARRDEMEGRSQADQDKDFNDRFDATELDD
ncbi:MAG: YkgJ family cysteine cluster protein [Methylococcales bacterium]|jgi:uncharacterized protein|nr:YkgJ family cysteine cluster protein [Methylococcales bacterium]MBT7442772.1 YkgJ family cysteine cluster protein [Methylococcales bacterium]